MKFWAKAALAILPALLLLGCGTSGEVKDETAGGAGEATEVTTGAGSSASTQGTGEGAGMSGERMGGGAEETTTTSVDPLNDPNSLLSKRVIYFDFDKSDIKDEFRDILNAHAEYLASHPSVNVTIEGHTDERGTREYNIALGERRANAVKRMLTLQGVSASQIRVISYGEERPAALGHDERAWALNRRAIIDYLR
ncbi:MAG TPA: peptidoglycan-associated lipoprotein Pal, partial [Gammaproteobacteria bacterium]|nr:peptidoglycan-associated lipoprotein Pal [Gammaproteobacteria bacterium]